MRQILKPIGYMTLVLLGAIVQIVSAVILKSLGESYSDDMLVYLLSFLGVLLVGLIVFEVSLIVAWRSRKTKSSNTTIQRSAHNRAIESRNTTIQKLRLTLANTENELTLSKRSYSEAEANIKNLERERDGFKQASNKARNEFEQERQKVQTSQTSIMNLERERDSFKEANNKARNEFEQERQKVQTSQTRITDLERERDNFKQVSDKARNEFEQERQKVQSSQSKIMNLERERDSFKEASNKARNEFEQEQQKVQTSQTSIINLERERDSFKQASDKAKREIDQKQDNITLLENKINDLEKTKIDNLEAISTDIESENIVLVSTQTWKKAGDNNEKQKWIELFLKIKNPSLRSPKERKYGDGFVYPHSLDSDGRRVLYLREKKEVIIIKVCEVFRHDKYDEYRKDGDMKSSKYKGLAFSYMHLENAT